jgi:hypothetical protein
MSMVGRLLPTERRTPIGTGTLFQLTPFISGLGVVTLASGYARCGSRGLIS